MPQSVSISISIPSRPLPDCFILPPTPLYRCGAPAKIWPRLARSHLVVGYAIHFHHARTHGDWGAGQSAEFARVKKLRLFLCLHIVGQAVNRIIGDFDGLFFGIKRHH